MRVLAVVCIWSAVVCAQDSLDLARIHDGRALRSSSNNTDLTSNDDSKRPIPGETVVLADLEGPGVVQHIWLTIAANEYAWPRLLRLRVYYDGRSVPSTARATFAPTPCTVCNSRNHSRSTSLRKPNSLIWSSRT